MLRRDIADSVPKFRLLERCEAIERHSITPKGTVHLICHANDRVGRFRHDVIGWSIATRRSR